MTSRRRGVTRRRGPIRVLDLCSGVGGAGRGYGDEGCDVTGVDIVDQPRYAGTRFVQADAVEWAAKMAHLYDFVHASPPCEHASALQKGTNAKLGRSYPELIEPIRDALLAARVPFVIENVAGAELRKDLMLCGEMFGLDVVRHRYFEVHGLDVPQPAHPAHRGRVSGWNHGEYHEGPYFAVYGDGGGKGTVYQWQKAMGIDWTDVREEIVKAIPPAFTRHIAKAVRAHFKALDEGHVPGQDALFDLPGVAS